MRVFDEIGESFLALIVSSLSALTGGAATFFLVAFIGARFIRGEGSYGFALMFCFPMALAAGVWVFIWSFRKIRSLGQ